MRGLVAGVVIAAVAVGVAGGAGAARTQAPAGKLLDTIVVRFSDPEPVSSKITLQKGVAYTLVDSGSGTQTSNQGTIECDVLYCLARDTGTPIPRGNLGFGTEFMNDWKSLAQFVGKSESDIPYNASHTYSVQMRPVQVPERLEVRSNFAHYLGCNASQGLSCSGTFLVKIYGPAQEEEEAENTFRFQMEARHPAKIRNPFGKLEEWRVFGNASPSFKTIQLGYSEPEWAESTIGRGTVVTLVKKKTQLRRSGPTAVLKIDVVVEDENQTPSSANLPRCPKGAKGTIVLIDDNRLVAGGEQKRGQTRDEVQVSVPACPFLSHRVTNADSLEHDPFVGGRKGSPKGGQWADVTIGASAAPEPDMTGKAVKTAAAALAMVEKWIRAAADECEITGWQIKVSGLPGLWKITATVTMAGKTQTALFNIAGNKLAARNAVATEILNRCQ